MVNDIVHTAVARKMLCDPVNNLIADTEFACAAGMLLRLLGTGQEDMQRAARSRTVKELSGRLSDMAEDKLESGLDLPGQNLLIMVKNYCAQDTPFTERLKELFVLGCERDIIYPRGRFLSGD